MDAGLSGSRETKSSLGVAFYLLRDWLRESIQIRIYGRNFVNFEFELSGAGVYLVA